MKNEFVPYDIALAMKELGLKGKTFGSYFEYSNGIHISTDRDDFNDLELKHLCSAPLYQQAFRWFREEHDLSHSIVEHEDKYSYSTNCGDFKIVGTYEEAELACLRKLIEIVKQNKDE